MKKLFTAIMLFGLVCNMQAEEIIIGSGTQTSSNLPTNTQWTNLTQQIYTAGEINHAAGAVIAVSFYNTQGDVTNRQMGLYMNNTNATSFGMQTIPVSGSRVFQGYWEIPSSEGWHTVVFDDYFQYDGTSNILVTFNDYGSDMTWTPRQFRVYETGANRSIYVQSDFIIMPSEQNDGTALSQNNQIKLHFLDGTTIVCDPSTIAMGDRPIGAWMRPVPFTITNFQEALDATGASISYVYCYRTSAMSEEYYAETADALRSGNIDAVAITSGGEAYVLSRILQFAQTQGKPINIPIYSFGPYTTRCAQEAHLKVEGTSPNHYSFTDFIDYLSLEVIALRTPL